jgi:hypothetical protein
MQTRNEFLAVVALGALLLIFKAGAVFAAPDRIPEFREFPHAHFHMTAPQAPNPPGVTYMMELAKAAAKDHQFSTSDVAEVFNKAFKKLDGNETDSIAAQALRQQPNVWHLKRLTGSTCEGRKRPGVSGENSMQFLSPDLIFQPLNLTDGQSSGAKAPRVGVGVPEDLDRII